MVTLANLLQDLERYNPDPESVQLIINGRTTPSYEIYRGEDGMLVVSFSEWGHVTLETFPD